MKPPTLLRQLGLVGPEEWWKVNCALYGFTESPADWANYRDLEGLRKMAWVEKGIRYEVQATPEAHLWKIKAEGVTKGMITVYVDDFLVPDRDTMKRTLKEMAKTWECSPPEIVGEDEWTRYCGYEIKKRKGGGYLLRQTGYLQDVIDRRQIKG